MDLPEKKDSSIVELGWTNEKHAAYLNSIEASFVRKVFGSNCSDHHHRHHQYHNNYGYLQPLDRHLPDCSDSTLDSKAYVNHGRQSDIEPKHSKDKRSNKSKKKKTSPDQRSSAKDQVVPENANDSSDGHGAAS